MRILLLTQWFDPEPTFKGLLFATSLRKQGHHVEVLTGFPNYPGGRVYDGFRQRPYRREIVDGITVHRVPLYPSHDSSALRRVANYLSFALTSTVGSMLVPKPDVVYLYHPPATAAAAALALKYTRGVPFVVDVQDLWPDTLRATGMISNDRILRFVGKGMRAIYRASSHVVVLSPGFARVIAEHVGARKVSVVPNWADEVQMGPVGLGEADVSSGLLPADRFTVLFAGTMGSAQGLDTVLQAAQLMVDERVTFAFVGGGIDVDRLRGMVEERGLTNVLFLPRQPVRAMSPILAAADALLVHLRDDPLFEITIPSKTQAYLMAGKPVLMGVRGDAADLVKEAKAGLAFEPGNATALADAVRRLAQTPSKDRYRMGRAGAAFYQRHLSLEVGSTAIGEVLSRASWENPRMEQLRRGLDLGVASAGIVMTALPMAIVALLIRRRLGSPVIFRQTRPGQHDRPFEMLKFRTMTDERGPDGELLPDSARVTAFGARLRSLSLDELPSLINVLRGEMSLVGPRPLLPRYTKWFTEAESRRLDVRPGMTGWAQVNGRNTATWDDRLAMDAWYVEHRSLRLDLRIMARTLVKVVRRSGFVADPESTMLNFDDERRSRLVR